MPATYEEVHKLLMQHDVPRNEEGSTGDEDVSELRAALNAYFGPHEQRSAVLGIDIYRYSHMSHECQRVVPTLFRILYTAATGLCKDGEPFIFQRSDLSGSFISTGDGGFQILDTPLHAIVFAVSFELALASYNGFYILPKLRRMIGPLSVRYALTYDTLMQQERNFFGPAIIRNARILSRDSLNRCLLDDHSVEWLQANLVSAESLLSLKGRELHRLPAFRSYDHEITKSLLFASTQGEGIRAVHLQKIGIVSAKKSDLDVYSLMLQVAMNRKTVEKQTTGTIIVTIGNLNTEGITA